MPAGASGRFPNEFQADMTNNFLAGACIWLVFLAMRLGDDVFVFFMCFCLVLVYKERITREKAGTQDTQLK